MEKELIKLLLNKKFYTKNKTKLSKEFFTNGTGDLYETIEYAHEDSDKDLSISEVSSLHMEVYNPATTRAKKEKVEKNCMMCYKPFMSEGNHNRICSGCKETDDWHYGNDYGVSK